MNEPHVHSNRVKMRRYPNIIITGTPGVGKTTTTTTLISLSKDLAPPVPLKHVSINDIAKKDNLYESYDNELQTQVVDEDRLLDAVEALISDGDGEGGWVIDWHACDLFPERWVDLVVVLRCEDTKVFWSRMEERGYGEKKTQENIDAEIFGVVAEEARDSWEEGHVVELRSVEGEEIESNAERVLEWVQNWLKDNKQDE